MGGVVGKVMNSNCPRLAVHGPRTYCRRFLSYAALLGAEVLRMDARLFLDRYLAG